MFIWYPILAVVMCMDETDTRVMAASRARLLGTIVAGVVSVLVHTILSGWIGFTVAMLIVVPLLRLLGWQSSLAIAILVGAMLFLVAGYWWVWDARLTSELVLLFLYIGFMSLHASIDDVRRADRASGLLALIGVVNVPIIYFSVKWWNTLHQGASVSFKGTSMATPMLIAMLVMALAFWAYCIAVVLKRVRVIILERERHTAWARAEMGVM